MKNFIASLLSPTGAVSFGRFMAFVMIIFCLGWDTSALVFAWRANMHLPPGLPPFSLLPDAITLGAQSAFGLAFYATTKYGDIKNPPPPTQ